MRWFPPVDRSHVERWEENKEIIVKMKIVEITTNRQRQNEMVPPCGGEAHWAMGTK